MGGGGGTWTPRPTAPYLNHWGLQVGKSGPAEENRICVINATADDTVSLNLISPIEWKLKYIYIYISTMLFCAVDKRIHYGFAYIIINECYVLIDVTIIIDERVDYKPRPRKLADINVQ